ncbi:MAG: TatD family hydrolase [Bacteroidia bacterium]|nr:TatD family hydrolase [Bacteroidia bacterium]
MNLTDTHTHLFLPEFDKDIDGVIQRAKENHITKFFLPNIDSSTIENMLELCTRYPDNCFPMMGLHPCSIKEDYAKELELIEEYFQKEKFYAVGEIGIDLYWDKTFLEEQKNALRHQIKLSIELDLPIAIHCRESFDEIVEVLREFTTLSFDSAQEDPKKPRGIFHCFTGSMQQAQTVIDLRFHIGIGGVVTFKNSGLDKVVEQIDLKHIVLETDSPYLAPVPFRGKRNESSYVYNIAEKIAELHQTSIGHIAEVTTANAKAIFGV